MTKTDIILAELKKDIQYIKEEVSLGFKGTHKRQDISNGRTGKLEGKVSKMEGELESIDHNFVTKEDFANLKLKEEERETNKYKATLDFFKNTLLGPLLLAGLMYLIFHFKG